MCRSVLVISGCRLQDGVVLGYHGDLHLGRSSSALGVDVDTCLDIVVLRGWQFNTRQRFFFKPHSGARSVDLTLSSFS